MGNAMACCGKSESDPNNINTHTLGEATKLGSGKGL